MIKINNFRGDLTYFSANKEALTVTRPVSTVSVNNVLLMHPLIDDVFVSFIFFRTHLFIQIQIGASYELLVLR